MFCDDEEKREISRHGPLIRCYTFFTIVAANEPEQFRNFYSTRCLAVTKKKDVF